MGLQSIGGSWGGGGCPLDETPNKEKTVGKNESRGVIFEPNHPQVHYFGLGRFLECQGSSSYEMGCSCLFARQSQQLCNTDGSNGGMNPLHDLARSTCGRYSSCLCCRV